jgi:hypothetical protein
VAPATPSSAAGLGVAGELGEEVVLGEGAGDEGDADGVGAVAGGRGDVPGLIEGPLVGLAAGGVGALGEDAVGGRPPWAGVAGVGDLHVLDAVGEPPRGPRVPSSGSCEAGRDVGGAGAVDGELHPG